MSGEVDYIPSISRDATQVAIATVVDGEIIAQKLLDADELSTLIKNLARLRADMVPEIPKRLEPNPQFTDVTRGTVFHIDRPHAVSAEFFIAARHPGYGWLAFAMKAEPGVIIANMILKQTEGMKGKIVKPKGGLII